MFFQMLAAGTDTSGWGPFGWGNEPLPGGPAVVQPSPGRPELPKVGHPRRDRKKIAARRKAARAARR